MSDHKFLYVFVAFAVLALFIVAFGSYQSIMVPIIVTNQTLTPTGYAVSGNPCVPGQCFNERCFNHNSVITNRVPKNDNCVVREDLRCWNGEWFYDSSPQKVCY
ncbi:hypothetical protein COV11_01305 [Candidatus Woesearchaeota archaeon CG10_big_fil_rev_8_21_14_0_10_30_7]|nr:MAG: hypothetical protein COV11_01305 [Candidatus Woesearchaeota archaeon CG10_big_fil_rev_8_21_14_0_10_30_7]